jgi:hypothetical protein
MVAKYGMSPLLSQTLLLSRSPSCNSSFAILTQRFVSCVRKAVEKNDYYPYRVCPYVRQFAWNSATPTGRIFVKFRIWSFYYNFSLHTERDENQTEKTDNLDESLRTYKISRPGWFS